MKAYVYDATWTVRQAADFQISENGFDVKDPIYIWY